MMNDFISFVQSRPFYVVVLCPEAEVAAKREAARAKKGYGIWTVTGLDNVLRQETPRLGMWLDSSALTPEETVAEIMKRAVDEALISS